MSNTCDKRHMKPHTPLSCYISPTHCFRLGALRPGVHPIPWVTENSAIILQPSKPKQNTPQARQPETLAPQPLPKLHTAKKQTLIKTHYKGTQMAISENSPIFCSYMLHFPNETLAAARQLGVFDSKLVKLGLILPQTVQRRT